MKTALKLCYVLKNKHILSMINISIDYVVKKCMK